MSEPYAALMAHVKQTTALGQISGLLGWDQETMMPRGASAQRAEWSGALASTMHARRVDPQIGDWLAAIDDTSLDATAQANLRHIRRSFARSTKIPADLAAALAKLTSKAQGIWADARAADDFAAFAPTLREVLDLARQQAAALAEGGDLYDALLDGYEPDMTGSRLDDIFGRLRPGLVDLRARIKESGVTAPKLDFDFAEDIQMALSRELAGALGYDWARGRLDKAVHPFSSGSGTDTRITTRVDVRNPFNCFYSTIHEVGHSCYEQSIDKAYLLTPLGRGVSMGVHESQSRIYENQLGRSRAFCGWLFGRMVDRFGDFGIANEDEFTLLVNAVSAGYIRTESDEVQYNLHVMLRFDLERALISGDLQVYDLEAAWNDRFAADFGYPVDKASNGVLQDVHWSVGLFGYFPTYSLGNIYAGCLFEALKTNVPELENDLARGETAGATAWLRENVQQFGGLYQPREVIEKAAGRGVSEAPLLAYLEQKFSGLYAL